tara:strand:+ start:1081 stop:1437 length:357 start_codon:yes stop_codon:yes gene_type:complete
MDDAPEKIWAMPSIDGKWRNGRCTNEHHIINNLTAPFLLEYTRSDIARAYLVDYRAAYEGSCEQIDELRAEVARLREALTAIAQGRKTEDAMGGDYGFILDRYIDIARAALEHGEADQ